MSISECPNCNELTWDDIAGCCTHCGLDDADLDELFDGEDEAFPDDPDLTVIDFKVPADVSPGVYTMVYGQPETLTPSRMVKTTRQQRIKLHERWTLWNNGEPYRQFRRRVYSVFMGDGAIAVSWCGMHLCIEGDGHCHT